MKTVNTKIHNNTTTNVHIT